MVDANVNACVFRLKDTRARGAGDGRKRDGEKRRENVLVSLSPFAVASFFSRRVTRVSQDRQNAKKGDEEMFIESSFPFVSITVPSMRRSNVFASS